MIPHDKDLFTAVPTTCYISSSQQNITGCDKTQEKKNTVLREKHVPELDTDIR